MELVIFMLKEKIKNKEKTIGMHINLNDVAVSRIAGLAGYDFIWIDMEHSYLSLENLMSHIIAIQASGTAVIVRVPQDDLTYTKKVIEMGVDGIIFPMVKTAEEADRLIASTLYPPFGNRGFGPMNAVGFSFDDVKTYVDNTKDNLCRFIQIEHIDAVNNLEKIIKNEYIDGYIFGPNDLSGSINELCNVFGDNTIALIEKSVSILKKENKYVGLSTGDTSTDVFERWWGMGIDMLSAGADFGMLQNSALINRKNLERVSNHPKLYQNKVFYNKNNLTPDVNCSLLPPHIFGDQAANADCYSHIKRKWQSAPSISKAYGKLFCCFSGDNFGGDEQPNNYNVIMQSADNGETWSTLCIIDHMDSVRMHEPIMWTDADGQLWHFWSQSYNWWDGRGGVWAIKLNSSNEKITWTKPKRICDGVLATPPITLTDGRIMLPISIWKRWKNQIHTFPNWGESSVYISDVEKEHFSYLGGADEPNSTFDENAIVQRADSSLYMIIRCEKAISYSVSDDLGKTWSKPQKLINHTSSRSYLAKFPSGNYLLVTNNSEAKRENMTAFVSKDECKTWEPKLLLDEREATSYPAGCIDSNGRVYVAYDFNRYTDKEVYYATFTEEELLCGGIKHPDSDLKKLVCKGGGKGVITDKTFETGE